ncbi:hypothetical protein Mal48_16020 [Thalassoglobus polymorphus]|uniref:Uncharacterized protein n=1 Tax=Thalassoglobus polymorphus TaxID=2527994 RepID=A0A517QLD6_9PLAN|nr:hypothetical protein Mal48_16020 [Thalassoglobus polymorphus]
MLPLCNMNEGLHWENAESKNWIKETRGISVGFRILMAQRILPAVLTLLNEHFNSDMSARRSACYESRRPVLTLMPFVLSVSKRLLTAVPCGRSRRYQRLCRNCGELTCPLAYCKARNTIQHNRLCNSLDFSSRYFRTGRKIP